MLLGKAFAVLMVYQSAQGGRAHFISHTTDKGEDKEQIWLEIKVLFCFTVTATALVRQIYSTIYYLAPS